MLNCIRDPVTFYSTFCGYQWFRITFRDRMTSFKMADDIWRNLTARRVLNTCTYHKTSNIRRILVGNKIVDHSDVVGASPVGAAPTTSSFST